MAEESKSIKYATSYREQLTVRGMIIEVAYGLKAVKF